MQVTIIMRGQDVSSSFTCRDNGNGSYTLEGQPPVGTVFNLDDFNEQTARVTINGVPARQVLCRSLTGPPTQYTVKADVILQV